jgi:hypothetical protein
MAEFGDSYADVSVSTEAPWEEAVPTDLDMSAAKAPEDDIAMVEILSQSQAADSVVVV